MDNIINTISERQKKRKTAEGLFGRAVKVRDNYTCRKCNSTYGFMEASHFITRGNKKIQFEFDNCFTLCTKCHTWAHREKIAFKAWVMVQLGNKRFYELTQEGNRVWRETIEFYEKIIEDLRKKLK